MPRRIPSISRPCSSLPGPGGSASSIELLQNHAYQLVVVPVLAPLPIAWVAVGLTVDDALAAELAPADVPGSVVPGQNRRRRVASPCNDPGCGHPPTAVERTAEASCRVEVKLVGSGESEQQFGSWTCTRPAARKSWPSCSVP